ncbi:kinesin-like protein KIN-14I isoform X1 [Portunus trituberculatus]|uniref:kinesin-like protein KIN-14I isoform X1 n=2 Tax=Portunus trituberculatus TaxID=210409 RepID=UPI001E1D03FE|nr:kinesin-like protein KIN-14I isoform X1 [Portunus trituberculatus]
MKERQMVEARRQGYAVERALLLADLDPGETMGGTKARKLRENSHPEHLRSLFEQVASLDHMLTSLENQIEVLTAVQTAVPKDLTDTFHDSGTSGHEPDSLEAIQTVVSGGGGGGGGDAGTGRGGGGGGGQQQQHHHHHHHHHHRSKQPGDEGEGEKVAVVAEREEVKPSDAAVLLHLERSSHRQTRRALQELREKHDVLRRELSQRNIHIEEVDVVRTVGSALEDLHIQQEHNLSSLESISSITSSDRLLDELKVREMTISQLRSRLLQLEKDRLDKVPVDAAREITRLNSLVVDLERARDELNLQNTSLKTRLTELTDKIHDPAATYQITRDSLASDTPTPHAKDPDVTRVLRKATYRLPGDSQKLKTMVLEMTTKEEDYRARISALEEKILNYENEDNAASRELERTVRSLEHQLEVASQKLEAAGRYATAKEEESNVLKLDLDTLNEENRRLKENLNDLILKQRDAEEMSRQKVALEDQFGRLTEENRVLAEDFNRERVLRKKYYNQVEEMKGKIRVFCRVRPVSSDEARRGGMDAEQVVAADDPFTVSVTAQRGHKAFLFDRVFQPNHDQEEVFADTNALIQSTLDGFNVTIMAYGQTGSGKTYTMIGSENNPGIAPRAFKRLFQLIEAGHSRHTVQASAYMMELYNDKLIDLLRPTGNNESEKLDIKKDKKGSVHVQGATVCSVSSAGELMRAFQQGLTNRHTAATKMNVESSRSHLIIVVCLTITSRQTGSVLKGKLTLVDLAGSERVSKSGASADQLREANSINKSLSALGDVVSALSSESSFVPYRNSKLTMLLQDSLGGNSKTLVFVNVSPVAHNADETLVSLMYASRIKQITNSVSRNSDNKEISRLKSIISKLKKGEDLDEDIT